MELIKILGTVVLLGMHTCTAILIVWFVEKVRKEFRNEES